MLFAKQNEEESSHFKVENTLEAIVVVLPDISVSHSSLSWHYNALDHLQRIWGWFYLEKCFFLPNELADCNVPGICSL